MARYSTNLSSSTTAAIAAAYSSSSSSSTHPCGSDLCGVWGRAALGRFGLGSRRGCVGMGADKGTLACALPLRGRPLVEAGAKASVGVVDPCAYFNLPGN